MQRNNNRVWIYQADRKLTFEDIHYIQDRLQTFVTSWLAHGHLLMAHYKIIQNRFIVLMVENGFETASGCSIDKSVAEIQQIGRHLDIDFFNRMQIAFENANGEIDTFHLAQLSTLVNTNQITLDTIIFNNTIATLAEYENEWRIPLSKSWMASQLKTATV